MANIFSIKDHMHKIMFPNIVAKKVEKMLPDAKREEKVKAISRILEKKWPPNSRLQPGVRRLV